MKTLVPCHSMVNWLGDREVALGSKTYSFKYLIISLNIFIDFMPKMQVVLEVKRDCYRAAELPSIHRDYIEINVRSIRFNFAGSKHMTSHQMATNG